MKFKKFSLKILREIIRLFHPPIHIQYYIMGLIDNDYAHLYNVETRKFSLDEIDKLYDIQRIYPKNILNYDDTIDEIVVNKKSIARLGDGEEFACNLFNDNPKYPLLKEKLINILSNGSNDRCLVCMNNFNVFDKNVPMFYRKHFADYWLGFNFYKLQEIVSFNKNTAYGDAYSFLFYFDKNDDKQTTKKKLEHIRSIWENKKLLFVVSKYSKILSDKKYFSNTLEKQYVFAPAEWAFSEYDSILKNITQNYDKEWIVYLELGSCATVLSYELSQMGYQALDMGSFYSNNILDKRNKDLF